MARTKRKPSANNPFKKPNKNQKPLQSQSESGAPADGRPTKKQKTMADQQHKNHIYQFSLLNALMDGVCETGISPATLASKGDIGLGTFARMDGELLMLEGRVYQLQAEGNVREASEEDRIPFAVATRFQAEEVREVSLPDKAAIDGELEAWRPGVKNLFMVYRIDGDFEYVKCRTVRGQEYPGQPLSELGKKQSVEEYENVRGTIIGFRTPKNWQGFGVAGEHLHFIREDCKAGGHVLEVRTGGGEEGAKEGEGGGEGEGKDVVKMAMAVASHVHVELPTGEDFNEAKLVTDDAGVKEVEG